MDYKKDVFKLKFSDILKPLCLQVKKPGVNLELDAKTRSRTGNSRSGLKGLEEKIKEVEDMGSLSGEKLQHKFDINVIKSSENLNDAYPPIVEMFDKKFTALSESRNEPFKTGETQNQNSSFEISVENQIKNVQVNVKSNASL